MGMMMTNKISLLSPNYGKNPRNVSILSNSPNIWYEYNHSCTFTFTKNRLVYGISVDTRAIHILRTVHVVLVLVHTG